MAGPTRKGAGKMIRAAAKKKKVGALVKRMNAVGRFKQSRL